jgi:organic radical activating enzyme
LLKRKQELDVQKQEEFAERIRELEAAGIPLFETIEIKTVNRCNGTCGFCPINHRDDRRPYAKMSEELFHKIIDELEALDYAGRISLFSNNEPLLDSRICEFAKYAKDRLKKACIIIFTNGTLMNYETFVTLIEHVDVLNFDIYYDNSSVEETPAEVKKILAACLTEKRWKEKVMVQFIPRNLIRNNRGGNSKNRKKSYEVQAPCLLPYIQMIVRPDGKTSLCCNDAMGHNTLADLNTETLAEAWYNSNYAGARERIRTSRQNIAFCKYCDNYAGLNTKGKAFFSEEARNEVWTKIKQEFA